MLEKEYKYFLDNQTKFIKEYQNKFIVIMKEKIIGVYDSQDEALKESLSNHQAGTFLIQFVSPDKDDYTQKYYSRVIFADQN